MKITILVDNQAGDGLVAEHGLSMWIEADGRHILFDTGQGDALEPNAAALGVDLRKTDVLVLSHGHYDHTGGIPRVLRCSPEIEVYCHPGVVVPRYSIAGGVPRPVHMPQESHVAFALLPGPKLHWVTKAMTLCGGIGLTGPIPRKTAFEDTGGPFYLDREGKRPDHIVDDLALWIPTERGLVVCVGCSHAGVVNTLNYIQHLAQGQRIRAVIGGFHLVNASRERVDHTISTLQSLEPDLVAPGHCTGAEATEALRTALGKRFLSGVAGMRLQF